MMIFLALNTVLQTVMVVVGHYSTAVYDLSAILGVGIPFFIAIGYGAVGSRSYKEAAKGAFIFSFVGAAIGVVVAILMGDQTLILLTFAPLASGVTGVLGGWIGIGVAAGSRGSQADDPVADGSAAGGPVADSPVSDGPPADSPVADSPAADGPVSDA